MANKRVSPYTTTTPLFSSSSSSSSSSSASSPTNAEMAAASLTNLEIARYWRRKRLVEEDHLYAAIKAAARVRARNLSDDDYLRFQFFLKEGSECKEDEIMSTVLGKNENKEIMVGIKDWWTKSKYAYLNQPAMMFLDKPGQISHSYLPNLFHYKSATA